VCPKHAANLFIIKHLQVTLGRGTYEKCDPTSLGTARKGVMPAEWKPKRIFIIGLMVPFPPLNHTPFPSEGEEWDAIEIKYLFP